MDPGGAEWERFECSGFYLLSLAVSLAQTERMAASSPRPVGTASLGLLAKYQCISAEVAVRPPGIST